MNASADSAKLSCSGLWKVYGHSPQEYFANTDPTEDAAGLAARIEDAGGIVAAADVGFAVPTGSIFVIMGLSGSGKSTVLRCLSRLVEPTSGKVFLDGSNLLDASPREMIEVRRHKMGMVFQNFGLLPHLTVIENVAFPLRTQGVPSKQRLERANEVIGLVGLEGREDSYPHQLSGGQQQRVGIARSLAVEPEVWFLDEPFSALDPLIRTQMQDEFLRLQTQLDKTIVFVTHDILEAVRLADVICIMKDGFVVQIGSPVDIMMSPADGYVAEFTKDVPLDKVLTAEAVMDAAADLVEGRPAVGRMTLLQDAIRLFDTGTDVVNVVEDDGKPCGALTPSHIVCALHRTDTEAAKVA